MVSNLRTIKYSIIPLFFIFIVGCSTDNNTVSEEKGPDKENIDEKPIHEAPDLIWSQIGQTIKGVKFGSYSARLGYSLDLNGKGNILILGAPGYYAGACDGHPDCNGYALVFKNTEDNWIQINQKLHGVDAFDRFGNEVDISDDGNTIIVLAKIFEYYESQAKVYKNSENKWKQIGQEIKIKTYNGNPTHVAMNGLGNIIATSAGPLREPALRAYERICQKWQRIGGDIEGESIGGSRPLSFNKKGDIIAIGRQARNGPVKVFQNNGGSWEQLGSDIVSESDDFIGQAVKLNEDGKTLIVGARGSYCPPNCEGDVIGYVKVYTLEGNEWVQKGQKITFDPEEGHKIFLGKRVTINADGNKIAIGVEKAELSGSTPYNFVHAFEYTSQNKWVQMGQTIYGNDLKYELFAIDMNDKGDVLACSTSSGAGSTDIFRLQEVSD